MPSWVKALMWGGVGVFMALALPPVILKKIIVEDFDYEGEQV